MNTDVFISYGRSDRAFARRLADALVAARGWSVWWDLELRAGEPFPRRIQQALAGSRCVIVAWSRHSVDSDWVVAEASEGWQRGVLVPVRLDDCEPPLPFRQTQAVDLAHWKGSPADGRFLALLEAVQRVLAHGEAADPAELEARDRRRRRHRRSKLVRRASWAMGALAAGLLAVVGARAYLARAEAVNAAEELARHADVVRREATTFTPEEQTRRWWALLDDDDRLERLELSVLLAAEGVRRAHTDRTEQALRASLALLPWSDWNYDLDIDNTPCTLDFNRDGRLLVAGGGSHDTIVVRLDTKEVTAQIPHGGTGGLQWWEDKRGRFSGIRGSCDVIDFSPAADVVGTAGPDETAALWDALTGRELHRLPHGAIVTAVAFDGTGRALATATEGGDVVVWDAASGQRLHAMRHDDAVYWVGFSPSSQHLVSASLDRTVRVWDPATGRERLRLEHDGDVKSGRFSADETAVATFGEGTAVRLWDASSEAMVWQLPDDSAGASDVLFDQQGRTMVTAGADDGAITWWDVRQRTRSFSVKHDSEYIRRALLTPDGRALVSIAADDEARVWDVAGGQLLKRMPYGGFGGGGELFGVAVSPDSRWFATSGVDPFALKKVIEVTEIRPADPVAAACAKLSRNLTREEWTRYVGAESYRETCPALGGAGEAN